MIKIIMFLFINVKVFEREINNKYANLLEMDEVISDIEALCYNKDAVSKMRLKIVELNNKLNKLSPLSQPVNIIHFPFLFYCWTNDFFFIAKC